MKDPMNSKSNFNYQILIVLILLSFIIGCQKETLSTPGAYNVTCYVATYGKGIFTTENGGRSWHPLDDVDQKEIHAYFKRIYMDPSDRDLLYVTTTGAGLFRLDLRAGNLETIDQFKDQRVTSIISGNVSSGGGLNRDLFVGIYGGGVFKKTARAGDWQPINRMLIYQDVQSLFPQGDLLYACTTNDLFRRDKTSRQWASISEGIRNKNILSIGADPEGKILYAGAGAFTGGKGRFEEIPCLYKSIDNGHTWTAFDRGIPDGTIIYSIVVNPKRPERIYTGTSIGIFRSIDAGQNWTRLENGLPKGLRAFRTFDIKIARILDGRDVVYAAGSKGVFMTVDDDETLWVNRSYGLPQTSITSIVLATD